MCGPALLILTLAAAEPPAGARPASAADAVRRADAQRCAALAARDLDGFLALLADDALFFPDRMPVAKGKEAVRTLLAPFFDPKGPSLRCEAATADVSRSSDLAYVTGTYDEKGTDAERGPTRGHGKYVAIWRRRGGAWRLVLHIGNAEPPAERDFGPPPQP
jgi:uncharacterized protein (TIGR02246 family)